MACLAAAIYLPSIGYDFVWDDIYLARDNPRIRDLGNWREWLLTRYWDVDSGAAQEYRPATMLSFALNRKFAGPGAAGFRAVNILLHAAVCAAAWALIFMLFGRAELATAAAALFAIHPAHVECVASIAGRSEELAALGFLGALVCSLRAFRAGPLRASWGWGALAGLAAGAGIASKESAVAVGPAIVLVFLFEAAQGKPRTKCGAAALGWHSMRPSLLRLAPPLAFSAAALAIYLAARAQTLGSIYQAPRNVSELAIENPFFPRMLAVLKVHLIYTGIFAWPFNPSPIDRASEFGAAWLCGLPALAAALWLVRRRAASLFGVALFFVSFIMTTNLFFQVNAMVVERLLYLPSLGLCVVAADLALLAWERRADARLGPPAIALLMALSLWAAALAGQALRYMPVWRDMRSFTAFLIRRQPERALPNLLYGEQLADDGRLEEAIARIQAAIRQRPQAGQYKRTLGMVYKKANRMKEAQEAFEAALAQSPDDPQAIRSLSAIYAQAGRPDRAETLYAPGLKAHPDNYDLRLDYALTLAANKKFRAAIKEMRRILPKAPSYDAKIWWALGRAYHDLGEHEEAIRCLRQARQIAPLFGQAQLDLGRALAAAGRLMEAESTLAALVQREPNDARAKATLADVRGRMKAPTAPGHAENDSP